MTESIDDATVDHTNEAGAAKMMWLLASADDPLTAREIGDRLDLDDITHATIRSVLLRLTRQGYLERGRRISRATDRGATPYEYWITDCEAAEVDG